MQVSLGGEYCFACRQLLNAFSQIHSLTPWDLGPLTFAELHLAAGVGREPIRDMSRGGTVQRE